MKGLLYKDARIIATSFRTMPLVVLVFLAVSVFSENGSFWGIYGIFIGCTMISTLQNLDESSKWCTYCDTLPISRSFLVKEKYLLGILFTLFCILFLVILRTLLHLFGIGPGFRDLGVTCLSMAMIGLISFSFTLMTSFLFGPQKGNIARLVMIMVMVSICMGIINYAPGFLLWFQSLSPILLLILGFVIPLAFTFLCCSISCAVFEKRVLP